MKSLLILSIAFLTACASTGAKQPSSELSRQSAMDSYQQALAAYRKGNTMAAMQLAQQSIKQDTSNWRSHELLGLLTQKLGENDTADAHFQNALRINPSNPGLLNNYGTVLCQRKAYAAAQENFKLAMQSQQNPRPEIASLNAGLCALQSGEINKAQGYFEQAAKLAPNNPTVRYQLAKLKLREGDPLGASRSLEHYLEYATHTPKTLLLGAQIETALDNPAGLSSYIEKLEAAFPQSSELAQAKALQTENKVGSVDKTHSYPSSIAGRDWILSKAAERYTIYVSNSDSEETLQQLVMAGLKEPAAIFETYRQGDTQFHLIAGDFASVADARTALSALPAALQVHAPWIRTFADIQRSIGNR